MKHSILLTSIGLCLFSAACGGADNFSSADDTNGGTATGAQWLPAVEVGDGGASGSDDSAATEEVVQSTSEDLSVSGWTVQLPNNTTTPAGTDHKPWYYSSGSSKVYADPTTGT